MKRPRCHICGMPITEPYTMVAIDGAWPEKYRNVYAHGECEEGKGGDTDTARG